jgi:hypothetical protein
VKTLRGITAPGILRLVVTLRAKKCKNSSSAQHNQIRFRFHTAWIASGPLSGLVRLVEGLRPHQRVALLLQLLGRVEIAARRWSAHSMMRLTSDYSALRTEVRVLIIRAVGALNVRFAPKRPSCWSPRIVARGVAP